MLLDKKNKKDTFLSGTIYQTPKAMLGCSKGILSAVLCHEGKRITYSHISVASSVTTLIP